MPITLFLESFSCEAISHLLVPFGQSHDTIDLDLEGLVSRSFSSPFIVPLEEMSIWDNQPIARRASYVGISPVGAHLPT